MTHNARRTAARAAAITACTAIPAALAAIASASVPALSWGLAGYAAVAFIAGATVLRRTGDALDGDGYALVEPRPMLPAPAPHLAARVAATYGDAAGRVITLP